MVLTVIGSAVLLMVWDATFGRLFGRSRVKRFSAGEEVVIRGLLARRGAMADERAFLCISVADGVFLAGDRLGAYRREPLAWKGETVEVKLRDLQIQGVPLAWTALRLQGEDDRYLVCERENAALVKAASARRAL